MAAGCTQPTNYTMLKSIFKRITIQQIIEDQLHQAKIDALEQEANAERATALAGMYRTRIKRLEYQREQYKNVGTTK